MLCMAPGSLQTKSDMQVEVDQAVARANDAEEQVQLAKEQCEQVRRVCFDTCTCMCPCSDT